MKNLGSEEHTGGNQADPRAVFLQLQARSVDEAAAFAFRLMVAVPGVATSAPEQEALGMAARSDVFVRNMAIPLYEWKAPKERGKVLFVHGWAGSAGQVRALLPKLLARGLSVLSFDAPGHGAAPGTTTHSIEMADIVESIRSQCKEPFFGVIGHSIGGTAAALFAQRRPDGARRLVLISTPFGSRTALHRFGAIMGATQPVLDAIVKLSEARFDISWDTLEGETLARAVDWPTLVLHDTSDRQVLSSEAELFTRCLRQSELFLADGLGHTKILFDEAVTDRVAAFVDEPSVRDLDARVLHD